MITHHFRKPIRRGPHTFLGLTLWPQRPDTPGGWIPVDDCGRPWTWPEYRNANPIQTVALSFAKD